MKKILLVSSFFPLYTAALLLSLLLLLMPTLGLDAKTGTVRGVQAQENVSRESLDNAINTMPYLSDDRTERIETIQQFLAQHNSPLEQHASYIVEVSETYGIDPRLIPAIAMQESNLCRKAPIDSYNCWGYGVYGNKTMTFSNYKEGIERVAFTLSQSYVKKGYSTIEQIMSKYTPRNTNDWAAAVTHFMGQME